MHNSKKNKNTLVSKNNEKWKKLFFLLNRHGKSMKNLSVSHMFHTQKNRASEFSCEFNNIFFDYSKQLVSKKSIDLLLRLAQSANIQQKIKAMLNAEIINVTEQRAVLHHALRDLTDTSIYVQGKNVKPLILNALQKIKKFSDSIRSGKICGYNNAPFTNIVNIGIGGSDLGPAMLFSALTPYTSKKIKFHFLSVLDYSAIDDLKSKINIESTLFIVSSKTFSTQETMRNAETIKNLLMNDVKKSMFPNIVNTERLLKKHFVAVTSNKEAALKFGIMEENIFPVWDWVGGRYSLWSSIGLIITIAIGYENFKDLLHGARLVDKNMMQLADCDYLPTSEIANNNMPLIMALLSVWNATFLKFSTQCIAPYNNNLRLLPSYLQQLEMESNGKNVLIFGKKLKFKTSPIIWGVPGTNCQHAVNQLIMQGTETVPTDFIISATTFSSSSKASSPSQEELIHHKELISHCLAQSRAFMIGQNNKNKNIDTTSLPIHKTILGNIPNNVILLREITPQSIGSLLAIYEYKVIIVGFILNINSFDQWGVELGKKISNQIEKILSKKIDEKSDSNNKISDKELDSSTISLINKLAEFSKKTKSRNS